MRCPYTMTLGELRIQEAVRAPLHSRYLAQRCFQHSCGSLCQTKLDPSCPTAISDDGGVAFKPVYLHTMFLPFMPMMKSNHGSIWTSELMFRRTWNPAGLRAPALGPCGSASRREMKRLRAPKTLIFRMWLCYVYGTTSNISVSDSGVQLGPRFLLFPSIILDPNTNNRYFEVLRDHARCD